MAAPSATTIPRSFQTAVGQGGDRPAIGFIRDGQLHWRTWRELAADVERQAAAIVAAGIRPGDRVAQVSENRYEWIVTDIALHRIGAVHVPIHATLSGEQIAEQIGIAGGRLAFVAGEELFAKFSDRLGDDIVVRLHDEQGAYQERALLDKFATANLHPAVAPCPPAPDDLATILFTSGTTGRPRGVMLSHLNLASNADAMSRMMPPEEDELRLCMLPLSHIYARTCDLYLWLCRGTRMVLAESKETVLRDCQLAQPTSIRAVPYFYQKLAERIRTAGGDARAALHRALGGKIRYCYCGGAVLDGPTAEWFSDQGLPVYCGYGLTEAAPVVTASTPVTYRVGTVGKPLDGVEVRMADDGEVVVRGPNVMLGYWQDETATREAIRGGWLHTGDLGRWEEGFLVIDGRKKELIVLSTGKKVSPARVESQLLASHVIAQVMVVGEGQSHLGALVVPRNEAFGAGDDAKIRATIEREISARQASAAREERVRAIAILKRPLAMERGELTPKGSLCRAVIAANFSAEIEALYRPATQPDAAGVAG